MMCYTTFNRLFHEYPVSGGKKGSVQLEALHPKPESLPCRAQGQQSFLRGYLEARGRKAWDPKLIADCYAHEKHVQAGVAAWGLILGGASG